MTSATEPNTTHAALSWQAIGFHSKALAAEAEIQRLAAVRTDVLRIERTEPHYRSLVAKQARFLKLAHRIERRLGAPL